MSPHVGPRHSDTPQPVAFSVKEKSYNLLPVGVHDHQSSDKRVSQLTHTITCHQKLNADSQNIS